MPDPAPRRFWLNDFAWSEGRIVIRKTGIRLAVNGPVLAEIASWAMYLVILAAATARARLRNPPGARLWFAPDRPRPWYMIRGAALWGGLRMADTAAEADAVFYFDDTTTGLPPDTGIARGFNHGCTDISKSRVAEVFEAVFGYPLALDPMTAVGEIVEKPETNGVHAGRIVIAPLPARPGFVYQRVVDTRDDEGCCHDLRTPCVAGRPVVVWIKTKTPEGRFSINNRSAVMAEPDAIFSDDERARIAEFCATMGLDWGGLDILRDHGDGRIYIVDVNKTDLGPVIALSWRDKIVSMERLANALRQLVS